MATNANPPIEVFISYSHKDDGLRQELEKHLKLLQRQKVISTWTDRRISGGTEWEGQIDAHLNSAQIILLLVSADFIASDYIWDIELKRAMERHEAHEARVIPVILRPCMWKQAPFAKLQALPREAHPVAQWPSTDEALLDVAEGIASVAKELTQSSAKKQRKAAPLDMRVMAALSEHFQRSPGDPKMSLVELAAQAAASQDELIQCLYMLREKKWADYSLIASGAAGLVWLTTEGIQVARDIQA